VKVIGGPYVNDIEQEVIHMQELVPLLMRALNEEWKAVLQYEIHASQLRGIFREGVGEHMKEHADDEERHAEELTAHLFGKGLDVSVTVPEVSTSMNHLEMIAQDLQLEVEAIDLYSQILDLIGDDPELTDTRVLIESILTDEVNHQDEFAAMRPPRQR
jgi:bacterioferritin